MKFAARIYAPFMVAIAIGVIIVTVRNPVEMAHKLELEIVQILNRNTVEGIV